jgi:hypothetical protein
MPPMTSSMPRCTRRERRDGVHCDAATHQQGPRVRRRPTGVDAQCDIRAGRKRPNLGGGRCRADDDAFAVPVEPMGITRGRPACPLEASRAGSRSEAAPARRGDEAPEPIPLCSSQSLSYPVWATSPALRARHGYDVPQYFSRIGMAANRFAGAGLRCGQSWSRRCRRGLCPLRDPMIACSTTKPIRNSPATRPLTHSVRPAAPTTASTR